MRGESFLEPRTQLTASVEGCTLTAHHCREGSREAETQSHSLVCWESFSMDKPSQNPEARVPSDIVHTGQPPRAQKGWVRVQS